MHMHDHIDTVYLYSRLVVTSIKISDFNSVAQKCQKKGVKNHEMYSAIFFVASFYVVIIILRGMHFL